MTNYRGESFAKKFARAQLWRSVLAYEERAGVQFQFVFLASAHGGDIRTLRELGVPDHRMSAIDRCRKALATCQSLCGDGPEYFAGSVEAWFEQHLHDFSDRPLAVYLDLCSPLCTESLAVISRCADDLLKRVSFHGSRKALQSVLAVNLLKGREADRLRWRAGSVSRSVGTSSVAVGDYKIDDVWDEPRHVWRQWLSACLCGAEGDVLGLLKYLKKKYPDPPMLVHRLVLLAEALRLSGNLWHPVQVIEYHNGVSPFYTSVWQQGMQITAGQYWAPDQIMLQDVDTGTTTDRAHSDRPGGKQPADYQIPWRRYAESTAECAARRIAINRDPVKGLVLDRKQCAAWRAVAKRQQKPEPKAQAAE